MELFFDLVFVVVISRLALDLAQDHSTRGTIEFGLQFFGVFWAWNAFTYYTERFETAGLQDRLLTLLSILPVGCPSAVRPGRASLPLRRLHAWPIWSPERST